MPFDVATAVKEIAKGHQQISLLRALAAVAQPGGAWPENAEELFDGVMKSLGVALSTLNPAAERIPHRQPEPAAPTKLAQPGSEKLTRKRKGTGQTKNKNDLPRKRMLTDSWTVTTSKPMNDAYQWRKYGEKKIHGTQFPRCYYRCAYREEQGCQAVKQVQQADNDNPPMFVVTNIGQHTCTIAEIVSKRGFAIVAAKYSSSSTTLGSGVRQGSCVPSASLSTEESPELDMVDEEDMRAPSPTGCPDQQDQKGCEQVEVINREFCNGASDMSDVMISSMLYPMSPSSTMHLELTTDPGATLGTGALEYVDDLWLF